MILSDTPGIIKPAYEMQASMMNFENLPLKMLTF
jgi:hypothetical protein